MAFIAGAYTVTYNSADIGQIENGIRLLWAPGEEEITGDLLGDSVQDGVYRGGNAWLELTMIEYNATGAGTAFWPWSDTFGKAGTIGVLSSSLAKVLVLTKVSGPNATPASLTANLALPNGGQEISTLLAPRLRRVPVRYRLFPYTVSSTYRWFTTT